ncbi:MAG: NAD(P)-dependent oxidoreductase [Clostridiales bacterium]
MMFRKLVAIEPLNFTDAYKEKLKDFADRTEFYGDRPGDNEEIIGRIGDADGVLVSYTTPIDKEVIAACPNIRYIGMCCSLYSPESANVDIRFAAQRNITVLGVRDYGDEGVVEYVVSELVRLLHGFGPRMWRQEPVELTGLAVGIVGMGRTGTMIAKGLSFFGADIYYYSRSRKEELEQAHGYTYLALDELLAKSDILCTCLNKNVVLLGAREFKLFGNGKILVNTSIGPSHEMGALEAWLQAPGNYVLSDTAAAIDPSGRILDLPNTLCVQKSAGVTAQARERLGQKVIDNIKSFFSEQGVMGRR